MSIPCSEDQEVIMLSSNSANDDNNNIEAFECSATTSVSCSLGLPTITPVTAPTATTTENLRFPVQVNSLEEVMQSEVSLTEPASKPFVLAPSSKISAGVVSTVSSSPVAPPAPPTPPLPMAPQQPAPVPPAPPPPSLSTAPRPPAPPPLRFHVVNPTESHSICEDDVVGFEADASSDEEFEKPEQETMYPEQETMYPEQETVPMQEMIEESVPSQETVLSEHFSIR